MRRPANDPISDDGGASPDAFDGAASPVSFQQLTDEQQRMVLSVEDLIHHEVSVLAPHATQAERANLVQSGFWGAIIAVLRFDPSRGRKFSTFAWLRVRGEILNVLRKGRKEPRFLRASREATTRVMDELPDRFEVGFDPVEVYEAELDDIIGDLFAAKLLGAASEPVCPDDALSERETHASFVKAVQEARKRMTKEERAVVPLLCIQDPKAAQRMRERLMAELSVTVRSIHRYTTRALKKLREAVEGAGITCVETMRDRAYALGEERPKVEGLDDL